MTFDPTISALAETPEQAAAQKDADFRFAELATKPLDLDGAKLAMGGIGQRLPEDAQKVAGEVALAEAGEAEEPLDLSAFDVSPAGRGEEISGGNGDETLIGKGGDDELGGEEAENNKVNPENIEKPHTQLSCEYAPLIEDFVGDGKLSPQEAHTLINTGIDGENFETVIENSGLPENKNTALMESCNYLGSETHKENAKAELETQIPEMFAKHKAPKKGVNSTKSGKTNNEQVSGGSDEMEWTSAHAEEAFGEVAAHYIGTAQTPEEQQAQLDLAFRMSAEKLGKQALSGVNISNQESYNNALKVAMSGENSPEARFDGLTTLTGIKNTTAGSLAEKNGTMNKNILQAALEKTGEYQAFLQAQEALQQAQKGNNPTAIKLAEIQRNEILSRANIAPSAIGEIDIAMEGVSESPTKTA